MNPSIGVVTIALNEEQYIGASLRSVIRHPNVKKVAVVEGASRLFSHAATEKGLSVDNTKGIIQKVQSEPNGEKIIYEQMGWAVDKSQMRNRALALLGKDMDYILVVDADEVWKQEDLTQLVAEVLHAPHINVFYFGFYHFWHNPKLVAVGSQWDKPLFRCFKYENKNLRWDRHEAPVVNEYGQSIDIPAQSTTLQRVHVYHYGAMKDGKRIREKLEYYRKRDEKLKVVDTWTNWQDGLPTQWTHGGGTVQPFTGTHPEEIERMLQ